MNNRELVEKLWVDLYNRDFDAVGAAFADDGEYTDMPTPADDVARGPEQIAARLRLGLEPLVGHLARHPRASSPRATSSSPSTSSTGNGRRGERASLPFVSMHEARDGKLVRWWDYWDLATLMNYRARVVGRAHHERVGAHRPARRRRLSRADRAAGHLRPGHPIAPPPRVRRAARASNRPTLLDALARSAPAVGHRGRREHRRRVPAVALAAARPERRRRSTTSSSPRSTAWRARSTTCGSGRTEPARTSCSTSRVRSRALLAPRRDAADRRRGLRVPRRSRPHGLHRRHREPAGRGSRTRSRSFPPGSRARAARTRSRSAGSTTSPRSTRSRSKTSSASSGARSPTASSSTTTPSPRPRTSPAS